MLRRNLSTGKSGDTGGSSAVKSLPTAFIVGKGNTEGISAYPVDGGAPKLLVAKKTNLNPVQWSEDGSSLYGYHAGEFPSRVYTLSLATGKEIPLQELKPESPAGVVTIAPVIVSRDGKSIAYSYNQTLSVLYLVSGLHQNLP
jgi:hypothetical protein